MVLGREVPEPVKDLCEIHYDHVGLSVITIQCTIQIQYIGANRLGGKKRLGAKRLWGAKRLGGKRPGGETTRGNGLGRNDPDSVNYPP